MASLSESLEPWLAEAQARAGRIVPHPEVEQLGRVEQAGDGVATLSGLPDARQDELLRLGEDGWGVATTLEQERIGCMLLSPAEGVSAGMVVRGTGEVVRVPVGEAVLGRVLDPLGRPLDDGPPLAADGPRHPVERPAPAIVDRQLVTRPLQTGVTVVDAMIPLGRGQRELILGDRQTGKTALAVDAIIGQRRTGVISVYCAIGQKASTVARVIDAVRARGAPERCLFVVASPDSAPGLQFLAPYAACTMAEWFRDHGRDALLVIDDLSKHAAIYRQVSLLLRRPPGREAFPGDVFYIHSRLLERAARLSPELGGGSLTALPIAETQGGNLSAYIPTNLISITDGQLYLEPKLFYEGHKPAVNVGKSVSRVGGKTQAPAIRHLSESLRLDYMQFLELEVFSRFGGMMDDHTRATVEHGQRIREVLIQPQYDPLSLPRQVALLLALERRILDKLPLPAVRRFKAGLAAALAGSAADVSARIEATGALSADDAAALAAVLERLAAEPA